jgi:hypothetical protein
MSGSGDEVMGVAPPAEPRVARLEPFTPDDRDLAGSAPLAEDMSNVAPTSVAHASWRQENLQRLIADERLVAALATAGFTGSGYRRFEEELADYGVSVLRAWMRSGFVFTLNGRAGISVHATASEFDELARDPDARDELANMTVAVSLSHFRDRPCQPSDLLGEGRLLAASLAAEPPGLSEAGRGAATAPLHLPLWAHKRSTVHDHGT